MIESIDFVNSEDVNFIDDTLAEWGEGTKQNISAVMLQQKQKTILRRAFGEQKLQELCKDGFEQGNCYHFLTGGNIDSLSFLAVIVAQQDLDYCLFSTWCMKMHDILQIEEWLKVGKIKRLDAYVGEIFPNSYSNEWTKLKEIVKPAGGRVCVFRNHAKIFTGTGQKFDFGIESSANIDTNPRTENTVISIGTDIYEFYKTYFDGINSFNRDFDSWTPWRK